MIKISHGIWKKQESKNSFDFLAISDSFDFLTPENIVQVTSNFLGSCTLQLFILYVREKMKKQFLSPNLFSKKCILLFCTLKPVTSAFEVKINWNLQIYCIFLRFILYLQTKMFQGHGQVQVQFTPWKWSHNQNSDEIC